MAGTEPTPPPPKKKKMAMAKDDSHGGPPLEKHLIALTIVLTIVFFVLVNEALRYLPRRFVALSPLSEWRFRNLAVSWIHADMATAGCIYWWVHSASWGGGWMDGWRDG